MGRRPCDGSVTEVGGGGHTQIVTSHTFSHLNLVSAELNLCSDELNLCVLGVSMCSVAIPCAILLNLDIFSDFWATL